MIPVSPKTPKRVKFGNPRLFWKAVCLFPLLSEQPLLGTRDQSHSHARAIQKKELQKKN
jgi:hypothetical protein